MNPNMLKGRSGAGAKVPRLPQTLQGLPQENPGQPLQMPQFARPSRIPQLPRGLTSMGAPPAMGGQMPQQMMPQRPMPQMPQQVSPMPMMQNPNRMQLPNNMQAMQQLFGGGRGFGRFGR